MPRTIILAAIALAALAMPHAVAQAQTVQTELHVEDPQPELGWSNGTISRDFGVALCYGQTGVNLLGGSFIIHISAEVPDWMNASHPESVELTPPMGPTDEPGCTEPAPFTVDLSAPNGIQPNETIAVQVHLNAEAETDEATGQPATGNYELPDDVTAGFNVTTVPAPQDPPEEGDEGGDANGSPGPTALVVLIVIAVMLRARRRR